MHVPASTRFGLLILALTVAPGSALAVAPPLDLAATARGVLQRHCLGCHDTSGRAKGGLSHITNLQQLVERGLVVPGKPLSSLLYQRVHEKEMPPPTKRGSFADADGERLRAWIAAGAPFGQTVPGRLLIEADALRLVRADLQATPARQRRFFRYLTLGCQAGRPASEQQTIRNAVAKLVNSLSWHPRLTVPTSIDGRQLVYRLDLRHYRWTARQWDRLAAGHPYRPAEAGPLARAVAALAGCDRPLLRADWFIANASRPPAYHDFLQMPTTDRALERLLQIDVPGNIEDDNVMRSGFNGSGVARGNRLLERHDGNNGAYWRSYDFNDNTGRQNLFEYPLGPAPGPAGFRQAGGEIIFHLPNGLQGYLLVDADGQRIDRAPGDVVSDPKRPDRIVENGLSCIGCHAGGVIPKEDQVRGHVVKNPRAFTALQREKILTLYAAAARLHARIKEDNDRFAAAMKRIGVRIGEPEPVSIVVQRYEEVVDLYRAADEVGTTAETLADVLRRSHELARTLGPLAARGSVQRQVFEEAFPRLLREMPANRVKDATRSVASGEFRGHRGAVRALAWRCDGKMFASAGEDGTVRIWDVAADKQRLLGDRFDEPRALAFSRDGLKLLSAGADRIVLLWDVQTGRRLARLVGHTSGVRAVAFSADGRLALSAGEDRTIRVWDMITMTQKSMLTGHSGTITTLAISFDDKIVLSAGVDRTVRLWDVATGKMLARHDDAGEVHTVAFSPDGKRIVSGGAGRLLTVRDVGKATEAKRLPGNAGTVVSAVWTADGLVLSASVHSGAREQALRRDDLTANRSWPVGRAGPVEAAAVAPDGRVLLASSGVIHLVRP